MPDDHQLAEIWEDLWLSVRRRERIKALSNRELALALIDTWSRFRPNSVEADILDIAIDRLRLWTATPAEIAALDEAELNAIEITAEDRAAMDRVWTERIKPLLDGMRKEAAGV